MRINIDIDNELLTELMALTGAKTKTRAVNEALRAQLRQKKAAKAIRALYGKIEWEGDLDAMRRDKDPSDYRIS